MLLIRLKMSLLRNLYWHTLNTIRRLQSKLTLQSMVLGKMENLYVSSKLLTPTEVNYAQITKELYAVVFACKHYNMFSLR